MINTVLCDYFGSGWPENESAVYLHKRILKLNNRKLNSFFFFNIEFIRNQVMTITNPDTKQDYKHHCLPTTLCILCSTFTVDTDFIKLPSTPTFRFQQMIIITHRQA